MTEVMCGFRTGRLSFPTLGRILRCPQESHSTFTGHVRPVSLPPVQNSCSPDSCVEHMATHASLAPENQTAGEHLNDQPERGEPRPRGFIKTLRDTGNSYDLCKNEEVSTAAKKAWRAG